MVQELEKIKTGHQKEKDTLSREVQELEASIKAEQQRLAAMEREMTEKQERLHGGMEKVGGGGW